MDWLEQHRVILNCYDKTFTWLNSDEKPVRVKGIPRKTIVRHISALQLKRVVRKGCKAYAVTITDEESKIKTDKLKSRRHPSLKGICWCISRRNSRITSEKGIGFHHWTSIGCST